MNFGVPDSDDLPRHYCVSCGYIHYENPRILVATMMTWEDRLLMMRRATEPGKGGWTAPGGFMEMGESPREAAARELKEEVGVTTNPLDLTLFAVGFIGPMDQVYLAYRGVLEGPDASPGVEALEVGLFSKEEFPWQEMAFAFPRFAIEAFFEDHRTGRYGVYQGEYLGEDRYTSHRIG